MKTAIELADEFPEQNLANIEPDAAYLLNGWGIEAVAMLLQQAEQLSAWLAANGPGGWIDDLRNKCEALEITNDALKADAERYRWMRTNSKSWSWTPSQYNIDIVSGFAAGGTGYLGHSFEDAINIASMKGKS